MVHISSGGYLDLTPTGLKMLTALEEAQMDVDVFTYLYNPENPEVSPTKPDAPSIHCKVGVGPVILFTSVGEVIATRENGMAPIVLTPQGRKLLAEAGKPIQYASTAAADAAKAIIQAFRESCNASAKTATDQAILDSIEIMSKRTLTGTPSVTITLFSGSFRGTFRGTGTTEDEAWAGLLTSLKRRSKFDVQTPGSEKLTFSLDYTSVVVTSCDSGARLPILKNNIPALLEGLQKAKELLE